MSFFGALYAIAVKRKSPELVAQKRGAKSTN
jgi:hypothetical protein